MINRLRTALRMIVHWTTGAMLISIDNPKHLVPCVATYVALQVIALVVDTISPPSWNKKES